MHLPRDPADSGYQWVLSSGLKVREMVACVATKAAVSSLNEWEGVAAGKEQKTTQS